MTLPFMRAAAISLLASTLYTGCDRGSTTPQPGRIAVIDLDRIAQATGHDKLISTRLQAYATEQESNLNRLRQELRAQLAGEQGDSPAAVEEPERIHLQKLSDRSERLLGEEIRKAKQGAEQLKVDLVLAFKRKVQPVAAAEAQARGISVVMIQQNGMLYVDPAADISDAVAVELQKPTTSTTTSRSPQ